MYPEPLYSGAHWYQDQFWYRTGIGEMWLTKASGSGCTFSWVLQRQQESAAREVHSQRGNLQPVRSLAMNLTAVSTPLGPPCSSPAHSSPLGKKGHDFSEFCTVSVHGMGNMRGPETGVTWHSEDKSWLQSHSQEQVEEPAWVAGIFALF